MKYFEVKYSDCFGQQHTAIVATAHETPETPTTDFNFSWNGNKIIAYTETTFQNFRTNHFI